MQDMTHVLIGGLDLDEEFIDREEELNLIRNISIEIAKLPSKNTRFRSHVLRYGWDYSSDKWVSDIPEWLRDNDADNFYYDSITINHYEIGQSIPPHIDSIKFDDMIEVVSLGGDCVMRFVKGPEIVDVNLPARSILVMEGEARYKWTHEVLPCKEERFSIVMRRKLNK